MSVGPYADVATKREHVACDATIERAQRRELVALPEVEDDYEAVEDFTGGGLMEPKRLASSEYRRDYYGIAIRFAMAYVVLSVLSVLLN